MTIDKFGWAIRKGFNELSQVRSVNVNTGGAMVAFVPYFKFEQNPDKRINVGETFGFRGIAESEIDEHRAVYQKIGDASYLAMLDQAEQAFELVRVHGADKANEMLREQTEDFYQTYIADETITQEFRPLQMGIDYRDNMQVEPEDEFMHKRSMQRLKEQIGQTKEIPHDHIRHMWDLE